MPQTLRDYIDEKEIKGEATKSILEGLSLCNPPRTSKYYVGIYNPKNKTITGSEIEEDGDHKNWGPILLSEIEHYFLFEERLVQRRGTTHVPRHPNAVADIGD